MKSLTRSLFTLLACAAALAAAATDCYVSPAGDDSNNGKSWAAAKATIMSAVNASSSGDNVLVAAGTYHESVTVKDGVHIRGGYNAATGARDIDMYLSIIDVTGLAARAIVKSSDCTTPTYIEGMVLQNASHSSDGGGAYLRGNMIMDRCIVRNCRGAAGAGVYAKSGSASTPAILKHSIIELCEGTGRGGGVCLYANAEMDGCIVRGCGGKYGSVNVHANGCVVKNSVVHNNANAVDAWPNSGGIFNETGGLVVNCTSANNYGTQYAGGHSVADVYNCIYWGNRAIEGFAEAVNYIASTSASSNNYADQGSASSCFASTTMSVNNMAANGPHFNNPTTFVGRPTTDAEIAAMQAADFSLLSSSPLINMGRADKAPTTDLKGVTRPVGAGVDVGAYEYDPNAAGVAVTGVELYEDTVFIICGRKGGVTPIISPANATDKRLSWSIVNPAIATVDDNGSITGVSVDTTEVRVRTLDGNYTSSAVVVILPVPPVKYPTEVLEADALYSIDDYTIPSYIQFWVAKEAARIDSLDPENDLTVISARLQAMNTAIANLKSKEEPYNMVANIHGDPATRMAFCWFTNAGINDGMVQLLPMENATPPDFNSSAVIAIPASATTTLPLHYAVSESGIIKATGMPANTKFTYVSHKALAENLTPGTAYSWRVGYDGHWSDIAHFRTKDAEQGEYSFVYMTDSHIQDREYIDQASWCAKAVATNESDARFCLFPGDFVETGTAYNSEWEWERWFEEALNPVIMRMPIVPTDGNHDDSPNLNYTYHFNTDSTFNMMAQSAVQFEGITYSFVYGDILFLVYSLQDWWRASGSDKTKSVSSYLSNDVVNWFREQIALYPNTKYRVTLSHKNIFSGSGHSKDDETPMFRDIMLPVFKECGIDLAIQGHDHCYEVIGPVDPDTRTAIMSAVSDVETVEGGTTLNRKGQKGGSFVTDQGTLYFIGATCGRKHYSPFTEAEMNSNYSMHKVQNYYDLFTGYFGQPNAPCYTRFTVKEECLELNSYIADQDGNATLINTMRVSNSRTRTPVAINTLSGQNNTCEGQKLLHNGSIAIRRNGLLYNTLGQRIR